MKKIILLISVVFLCFNMSACMDREDLERILMKKDTYNVEQDQKNYREVANVLTKLGITGITGEMVHEMEKYDTTLPEGIVLNKYLMMLGYLGAANVDHDTWEQTPNNDSVYAFDIEVFNLNTMYSDFLEGIAAIGDGELDFSNIQEDTSQVDWKAGTGPRSVTFDWNGKTYTINAKNNDDWFDVQVIDQLNRIIIETGSSRHLYFTGGESQDCILFYRDADWAKEFQEATGLELWDKTE